jgi:hypothetical protein
VELGQVEISVVDAIHYLAACKIFITEAQDILTLCRDAERKLGYWLSPHGEWLEDTLNSLIFHEASAARATSYEPMVIPGLLPALAGERALFGGPFQFFEYEEHRPPVYLDHACSGAFLEDGEFVADYRRLLAGMRSVALDEAKSRAFTAELADALDQRSRGRDAGIHELEEEQF